MWLARVWEATFDARAGELLVLPSEVFAGAALASATGGAGNAHHVSAADDAMQLVAAFVGVRPYARAELDALPSRRTRVGSSHTQHLSDPAKRAWYDQLTGAPAGTSTCDERELDALRRFHAPFNAALWAHMRAHYADESALVEAAAARDESVREHLTWLIDAR